MYENGKICGVIRLDPFYLVCHVPTDRPSVAYDDGVALSCDLVSSKQEGWANHRLRSCSDITNFHPPPIDNVVAHLEHGKAS